MKEREYYKIVKVIVNVAATGAYPSKTQRITKIHSSLYLFKIVYKCKRK